MSTGTTARRHRSAVAESVPNDPVTVVPAEVHTAPAANHEVASADDTASVDPLLMISVAFVLLFALLAILSAG